MSSNEDSIEEDISIKNSTVGCGDVERSSNGSSPTRPSSENASRSESDGEPSKNTQSQGSSDRICLESRNSSRDDISTDSEASSLSDDDETETISNASSHSDEDLEPIQQLHLTQYKARSLIKNGQATSAQTEYIRCLALARIVYGDHHWCLAQAHMILAKNYLDLKHHAKQALEHGNLAKDIIILWKTPPKSKKKRQKFFYVCVNIYVVLGRAQIILGQYPHALKNLLKAKNHSIQYARNVSDESKESIINSKILTALAKLNFEKGNFEQSVKEYEEAIELLVKVYGKMALVLVSARQNLGKGLQRCGKFVEADKQFETALEIAEKLFGPDSENAIKAELHLARNYLTTAAKSTKNTAEHHLRNVISKVETLNSTTCNVECEAIDLLVPVLISTDRHKEAKQLIESNLSKFFQIFGQTSKRVILNLSLLGSLCLTLDEPALAAKYFRKCYDRELALFGISHPRAESTKLALELVCQNPVVPRKYRLSSHVNESRPKFIVSRVSQY